MADERNKNKNRNVDEAGIRLAPTPIRNSDYHVLPSVIQEYVIQPTLQIDEPKDERLQDYSTADDFQPKVKDKSKKWKRRKRGKNIAIGAIMLLVSVFVVLPYILAVAGQTVKLPIKYVPDELDAIGNLISAFKVSAANGWHGNNVTKIWIETVPSLFLVVGILFLLTNAVKSIVALVGAVRPKRYLLGAGVYFVCVCGVLVLYLIGVKAMGIEQISFVKDVLKSYSTSEIFALLVVAAINLVVSAICTFVNRDKLGYIK